MFWKFKSKLKIVDRKIFCLEWEDDAINSIGYLVYEEEEERDRQKGTFSEHKNKFKIADEKIAST